MAVVCISDIACIDFQSEIPCYIDLIEPFTTLDGTKIETSFKLEAGETYDLDFLYKVGVPGADMFHVFFYDTPDAAYYASLPGVDPTERQAVLDQPALVSFTPAIPQIDITGILEQKGVVRIEMPTFQDARYFGLLAMSRPKTQGV